MYAKEVRNANCFYYRELPPTSLLKPIDRSILGDSTMYVSCFTGWRKLTGSGTITYHRGIDIAATYGADFYAPEAGEYYVYKAPEYKSGDSNRIKYGSGDEDYLKIDRYSELAYGFIGVLMTNPADPLNGRIYLFSHMGPATGENDTWDTYPKLPYADEYTSVHGYSKYPGSWQNRVAVGAGQWIGKVGERGNVPAHIHLEVYEYFPDDPRKANSGGWQRVEPLSCFDKKLFMNTTGKNTYQA